MKLSKETKAKIALIKKISPLLLSGEQTYICHALSPLHNTKLSPEDFETATNLCFDVQNLLRDSRSNLHTTFTSYLRDKFTELNSTKPHLPTTDNMNHKQLEFIQFLRVKFLTEVVIPMYKLRENPNES